MAARGTTTVLILGWLATGAACTGTRARPAFRVAAARVEPDRGGAPGLLVSLVLAPGPGLVELPGLKARVQVGRTTVARGVRRGAISLAGGRRVLPLLMEVLPRSLPAAWLRSGGLLAGVLRVRPTRVPAGASAASAPLQLPASPTLAAAIQGRLLALRRVRLRSGPGSRPTLRLTLALANPLAVPLTIHGAEVRLAISGAVFGSGALAGPVTLAAGEHRRRAVDVDPEEGAVDRAIARMRGREPRFVVRATLAIAPLAGVRRLRVHAAAGREAFAP